MKKLNIKLIDIPQIKEIIDQGFIVICIEPSIEFDSKDPNKWFNTLEVTFSIEQNQDLK